MKDLSHSQHLSLLFLPPGAMTGIALAMMLVGLLVGVAVVFVIGFLTGKKMPLIPQRAAPGFAPSRME